MSQPRAALRRAVAALALVVTAGVTVVTALPAAAAVTVVPRLPHLVAPAVIEDAPPYVPQVSCDAVAKPGVKLFRDLVMATYRRFGAQDWGMAVSCAREGMTSEHADGRAWDLGLNMRNRTQRAAADRLLAWLYDADAAGTPQANARRFGVMYVIYADKMRMTGGDWRPYLPATCGAKKHPATVCHEDHIHLSFTWNGAYARTSAWTGTVWPTDYGPCVPAGAKVAPRHTAVNPTPCPGTREARRPQWTPPAAPVAPVVPVVPEEPVAPVAPATPVVPSTAPVDPAPLPIGCDPTDPALSPEQVAACLTALGAPSGVPWRHRG